PQVFYPGVLFSVDGTDVFTVIPTSGTGQHIPRGLVTGSDGDLYGTASDGNYPYGAVVRLTTAGTISPAYLVPPQPFFEKYVFTSTLFEDADQSLYGGTGGLAFLRIDPEGTETAWNVPDDVNNPINGLILASDQNFYATLAGSPGQFVRLDPAGNLTRLYTFDYYVTGGVPRAVFQGADGYFYGAAYAGGPDNLGTIFRLDSSGNAVSLHDFILSEGYRPSSDLLRASDGNLYGTTLNGGQSDDGTLFRFDPVGLTLTPIHPFAGTDGSLPLGRLIQASDGYIYGTTSAGGLNGFGVVYRSDLAGNVTNLYDSAEPLSDTVVERSDGFFYGCVLSHVFKIDGAGNATTVHDFNYPAETCQRTGLMLGLDGSLYGLTGTTLGGGAVFRISDVASPAGPGALEPTSGRSAGGGSVRISGHHFRDGLLVSIGGFPATGILVDRESLLTAIVPALPPGTLQDVSVADGPAMPATATVAWFSDFLDVSGNQPFHDFVETIFRAGITAGCGVGNFCPSSSVTRAQMAVFLLKAEHGSSYVPPACTGIFGDVPCPSQYADWIEQLANEGITDGCGGGDYCPGNPVTRAQIAVFLLKAEHGASYEPPACSGIFGDVTCPSLFADWIEQIYNEGITRGCGTNPLIYCPASAATRGQMAVFLTKTFHLQ
ncbi:MAG TPA: choice-of-anchor tandem repeat GloVer-containing protein, partial [Thermoanaerobaculia bacterium]|nr:choice-of-anchor tandem repeat GloVer-containing protein [Thermoanaerobaculia bacterium]